MFTGKEFVPNEVCKRVHGLNGIGEIELPEADKGAEEKDAAAFMAEMAQKYGKELVIVATAAMIQPCPIYQAISGGGGQSREESPLGVAQLPFRAMMNRFAGRPTFWPIRSR